MYLLYPISIKMWICASYWKINGITNNGITDTWTKDIVKGSFEYIYLFVHKAFFFVNVRKEEQQRKMRINSQSLTHQGVNFDILDYIYYNYLLVRIQIEYIQRVLWWMNIPSVNCWFAKSKHTDATWSNSKEKKNGFHWRLR